MSDAVSFAARALISALFLIEGWKKVVGYGAVAAYMEQHGVSSFMLPAVIAIEFVGGAALLAGFMTRWAALVLAVFTLLAAAIFHMDLSGETETVQFLKNLAIAGGLLMLYVHGGGAWSMSKGR